MPRGAVSLVVLVSLVCGCSLGPEPELVYQQDEPDLNTVSGQPMPELGEGDHAIVALTNGEGFEAKCRGIEEGILEFADVEWDEALGRDPEPTLTCALDEVSEIRRQDWSTADDVVAWTSIAAGVVVLVIYGSGHGDD